MKLLERINLQQKRNDLQQSHSTYITPLQKEAMNQQHQTSKETKDGEREDEVLSRASGGDNAKEVANNQQMEVTEYEYDDEYDEE